MTVAYFAVEHKHEGQDEWHRSEYGEFLARVRNDGPPPTAHWELVQPTHECWQATSKHEFLEYKDALAMFRELETLREDVEFRLTAVGEARRVEVLEP